MGSSNLTLNPNPKQELQFYADNYPDTVDAILALGIDHVYTTPYFLALIGLLGCSLAACRCGGHKP